MLDDAAEDNILRARPIVDRSLTDPQRCAIGRVLGHLDPLGATARDRVAIAIEVARDDISAVRAGAAPLAPGWKIRIHHDDHTSSQRVRSILIEAK